jgi:putative ABC transport system permease protein
VKFSRLILANLFRKKVRLMLTLGSFAVALFLFAFLAVIRDAFGRGADVAGADRLVIINRVSIIQPLPLSYRDKILRIPGVKAITHNNWFGGVYQEEKNFFPQFVIDVENQRKVIPELIVPAGRDCRSRPCETLWLEDRRPHPDQKRSFRRSRYLGFQHRWHLPRKAAPGR